MRKRLAVPLMLICAIVTISGCSNKNEEKLSKEEEQAQYVATREQLIKERSELAPPDVDLSVLSQQEAYEKAKEIFENTDEYITKRIKLTGVVQYNDEDPDNIYATINLLADNDEDYVTFEFVLHGSYVYPNDYPPSLAYLTMTGTYSLYNDNGSWVAVLLDGVIEPESYMAVTEGDAESSDVISDGVTESEGE
jgi:hypothetical protein